MRQPYLVGVVAKCESKNQNDTYLKNIELCVENVLSSLGSRIIKLEGPV